MKYVIATLFLIPLLSFGQQKGDTRIIVKASDTSNLFNRVVSYLYDKGYSLERKDDVNGFLQTDEHGMKINALYKIKAVVRNGEITFTSTLNLPTFDKSFDEVKYTKNKTFDRQVWDIVDEIAKQFGTVTYN
jgi:hypothetical protein